jgi:hypothetical protein
MKLKQHNLEIAKSVLDYLYERQGEWTCLWNLYFNGREDDVAEAMPKNWSRRRRLALMRVLYRNELVGGCDCGCRGDFEITDKGLDYISKKRTKTYTGY